MSAAGLDAGDPIAWRVLLAYRIAYRSLCDSRTEAEAEVLAFGDCLVEWHRRHGAVQNPDRCAGCSEFFTDRAILDLGRSARVHLDLCCLTRYGQAWRSAAVAGLHALGIEPPARFELL